MKKRKKGSQTPDILTETQKEIISICDEVKALLLEKNQSYGNSFANPIGVFAPDLPADAQIRVRIDDKLARIRSGNNYRNEDTIIDTIGYLNLYYLLIKRKLKVKNAKRKTNRNRRRRN